MMNCDKKEKSRGLLVFAINTDTVNYESIAENTIKVASQILKLPYTIITNKDIIDNTTLINTRFDVDTNKFVEWKNYGRFSAYDLSPYDETLVIDADCLILDSQLKSIFDLSWDYLLQRSSHAVTTDWPNNMGATGLPYIWATMFAFRKTPKAKMFFRLVSRIQMQYAYYRSLFNIQERNFRNDYAFAIADIVLNGYTISGIGIPGSLLAIDQTINSIDIKNNSLIVRDNNKAYLIPKTNLHLMSKQYLQTQNFNILIENILNELA